MSSPTSSDIPELIKAKPVKHWGRWVSAAVVAVLAAMMANGLITNQNFHWDIVLATLFRPEIFKAIGWTLLLTVVSMVIGIALAVTLAIMRRSENPILRWVSMAYIWFFRGTPIYTQLIFWGLIGVLYPRMSLGIPFGPEFFEFRTYDVITAGVAAMLGLGLNEAAYLSEIVRSGLNSVDVGQEEAARAVGMNERKILQRIVIPQAMRVIVPPTGNETISMLKTTSLVTAVPFTLELTRVTNDMGTHSLLQIPYLVVAAIWYLVITSILMVGQAQLERYYGKGTQSERKLGRRAGVRQRSTRQEAINAAQTTPPNNTSEWTP
ncbi:MAG: amino acid ABC transporter permease [Ancrocorticia sp.]|uniref:amino acid ABC transporter permease n=2 Tax=Ancrocorticia sp. TaxID=2593684 RepID=UPI003F922F81